jgi:uncharacterized protein YwgA
MNATITFPWERLAVIVELSQRLQGISPQFGKMALQKMIFLLQEVYKVNCGYEYSLYIYGPYCAEVFNDLDLAVLINAVKVSPVREHGFAIEPGESSASQGVKQKASAFLSNNGKTIEQLVERFGNLNAKELELQSTIVYVDRDCIRNGENISKKDFIDLIKEIKPKFAVSKIEAVYDELSSARFIDSRG